MKHRPLKQLCGLLASAAIALVLVGCNGKAGQNGTNGTDGNNGTNGTTPVITVSATQLTKDDWAKLVLKGDPTKTTASVANGKPTVTFMITNGVGVPVSGLTTANMGFSIAKLIPTTTGSTVPSRWVSYMVWDPTTSKAGWPEVENKGALVYNLDGTYTYTFATDITKVEGLVNGLTDDATHKKADLDNLSYVATATHRLMVAVGGLFPGDNTTLGGGSANIAYDFIPSTGKAVVATDPSRVIADMTGCNECHANLSLHSDAKFFPPIQDVKLCAVCHTDQQKYGQGESQPTSGTTLVPAGQYGSTMRLMGRALPDFPNMVHHLHMGEKLYFQGYNQFVAYNEVRYPQDQSNCSKCHSNSAATPEGDNWKKNPSMKACGGCHDNVDFAAGVVLGTTPARTHVVQTSDVACAGCHGPADIPVYHYTANATPNNPTVAKGLANFTYQIKSASQATSGGPVTIVFRVMKSVDGSTPAAVTYLPAATPMANPLTGFSGSAGFLLAFTLPQEGILTPSDYNNLGAKVVNTGNGLTAGQAVTNFQPISFSIANLLDTAKALTVGTLSATPDASGYYTATVVGPNAVFPAGAMLRSVGLQGYFTQAAGTWDSSGDGIINASDTLTAPRHTISVVRTVDNGATTPVLDTVRRVAVDSAKCANCHEWFEGHGGNRVYEVQVCVQCHVGGLTTSGKGASNTQISTYYNVPVQGAGPFTAEEKDSLTRWTGIDWVTSNPVAAYATANPASPDIALKFPQTTNNFKDMIHGIHASDFRNTPIQITRNRGGVITVIDGVRITFPGILSNCQGCHTPTGYNMPATGTLFASREEAINPVGNTTAVLANAALVPANVGDLMTTPFTAACVSCHDSTAAQAHMKLNGGQIKVVRTALASAGESCAVCHGATSEFAPSKVHK